MNNELVRILREQAEQYAWKMYDESDDHVTMDDTRRWIFYKFAELIVGECIKLCEHESNDDEYDQYDMGMSVKAENIKASIFKEFGVK